MMRQRAVAAASLASVGAAAAATGRSSCSSASGGTATTGDRNWGAPRPPKTLPALGGANAGGGVLLLSDLDGTLYSHAPGAEGARSLARFNRHWLKAEDERSILCYNTARNMKDYRDLVAAGLAKDPPSVLLVPDVLCTGGGTAVQFRDPATGALEPDVGWSARVEAEWAPVLPEIGEWLAAFDEGHIDDLNTEPDARAALTVWGPAKAALARDALRAKLGDRVTIVVMESWVAGAWMVTASPPTATKRNVAVYVAEKLGVRHADCLWAGDTEGDESMLDSGMRGVCVRNATPGLLAAMRDKVQRVGADVMHASGHSTTGVHEALQIHQHSRGAARF
mmetsp:Transcript_22483/g.52061  ORF Transcript_22483/g.52061 Transcript_22483/m.52061 type:complete len:337 (-) Transcript_22483:357-1367(-)